MYEDNQEVSYYANREINHANKPGAPREDFDSSWKQAIEDANK